MSIVTIMFNYAAVKCISLLLQSYASLCLTLYADFFIVKLNSLSFFGFKMHTFVSFEKNLAELMSMSF